MEFKEIKELIKLFDKSELNKLKVKEGEFEVSMGKGCDGAVSVAAPTQAAAPVPAAPMAAAPAPTAEAAAPAITGDTITAPMIGTFYSSPSPESSAFVKVGDIVKAGQTVCILEAMKIMNEVEAECDCKILEVLINDSEPVEYDMPLFVIEKI